MVPRFLALIILIANLVSPAAAQQRVSVVTQRLAADGALFIAGVKGYFKAEGIDIQVGAYNTTREVLEAVASGRSDFGLTELTPAAFNLAGRNAITIVAAQAREKRDFEGAELVASNAAYDRGMRKFEDIAGKVVGIEALGTQAHAVDNGADAPVSERACKGGRDRQGRRRDPAAAAGARCHHRQPGQVDRLDVGHRRDADRRAVHDAEDDQGQA